MFFGSKKTIYPLGLIVFLLFSDRILKYLAASGAFRGEPQILGSFLKFNFVPNQFISFSLPITGRWLVVAIAIILIILSIDMVRSYKKGRFIESLAFSAIILGAISNLYDRVFLGYVIDYLDMEFFTVFNVADIMIVGGVAWLCWVLWREEMSKKHNSL